MFSNLFGHKLEKDLKNLVAGKGPELTWHYRDSEAHQVSKVMKLFRDSMVILGFSGKLRQREIEITFLGNGVRFQTSITRSGPNKLGQSLFHCRMPEKLLPPKAQFQRFRINGAGNLRLMVGTMRGDKSLVLPLYEVSTLGLNLINDSDVEIKVGTKFFQAMASIGSGNQSHLVDLRVANVRPQKIDGKTLPLLVCAFTHEPRSLGEMLSQAKANQRS